MDLYRRKAFSVVVPLSIWLPSRSRSSHNHSHYHHSSSFSLFIIIFTFLCSTSFFLCSIILYKLYIFHFYNILIQTISLYHITLLSLPFYFALITLFSVSLYSTLVTLFSVSLYFFLVTLFSVFSLLCSDFSV